MNRNFAARILKMIGWTVSITVPDEPKCLICVAPHTSNWDFILGKLAYSAAGRNASFLMKSQWFFWPLGGLFRSMGGIAVDRENKKDSMVEEIVEKFKTSDRFQLAITPEGTRRLVTKWHTGILRIAQLANVPIQLGVIDYEDKKISIEDVFVPTGNLEVDSRRLRHYYVGCVAKYPDNFSESL